MRFLIVVVAISMLTQHAYGKDAVSDVCRTIFASAESLIANKEKGQSEATMRGALPSVELAKQKSGTPQAILLEAMHEMVTEVYGGDTPQGDVYATYRAEVCERKLSGKPVPQDFTVVRPALQACASSSKDKLYTCAMKVAGSTGSGT